MGATPWRLTAAGLGVLIGLTGAACSSSTVSAPAAKVTPVWKQIWSDDFNGPAGGSVNAKYWEVNTGRGVFGTGEIETMTSSVENVHLDGHGDLDLVARGHGAAGSKGAAWTSGRIRTRSEFAAPPGGELMVTASIEQPDPGQAVGYWPAFWMLGPKPWPGDGEIDIMEDVNGLSADSGTLHCGHLTQRNPDGTYGPCHETTGLGSGLQPCPGCQQGFHTYTVIIDRRDASDQQIRWYLDGHQFFSVSEPRVGPAVWTAAVDHGFSILFDVAVGGTYPSVQCQCTAPSSQTSSAGTMVIRYVRVLTT
jgi:beta-glucanase (GH16 family)